MPGLFAIGTLKPGSSRTSRFMGLLCTNDAQEILRMAVENSSRRDVPTHRFWSGSRTELCRAPCASHQYRPYTF